MAGPPAETRDIPWDLVASDGHIGADAGTSSRSSRAGRAGSSYTSLTTTGSLRSQAGGVSEKVCAVIARHFIGIVLVDVKHGNVVQANVAVLIDVHLHLECDLESRQLYIPLGQGPATNHFLLEFLETGHVQFLHSALSPSYDVISVVPYAGCRG